MVAPIIAAGVMTVARFIAKKGIQQAVKKYGKKAATEAKKHVKDVTTPTREGVKQTRAGVKGMQNYRRGTRIAGGIGVAAGIGVGAVATAKELKKQIKEAKRKGEEGKSIERLMRKLQAAEKKETKNKPKSNTVTTSLRPKKRPSTVTTSLRPKARPKKK
tara:strand:- start:2 stop:481 length:480 start_codon:yes stop_codon:yes gene_type:complete